MQNNVPAQTNAQTNLVARHLAGLFNGVSEQAPTIRLDNQAQAQVNGWSNLVEGLCTRPPTRYIATPFSACKDTDLFQHINRDESERYILKIKAGGTIEVSDITGRVYPCVYDKTSKAYINSTNPKKELLATTIADYTFIANRTKVATVSEGSEELGDTRAVLNITLKTARRTIQSIDNAIRDRVEEYSPAVSLSLEGVSVATISEKDSLSQTMDSLVTSIGRFNNYRVNRTGDNILRIYRSDGGDFSYNISGATASFFKKETLKQLHYDSVAYVYVAKGVAEQNYVVYIDGKNVATYTSGDTNNAGTYKTDVIANSLYTQIQERGYGADLAGSCIKVFRNDAKDFDIEVDDSWGNAALKCFKGQAQAFTDLPGRCFEGAVLKIIGKAGGDSGGGYWVRYEKENSSGSSTGSGLWVEYRQPYLKHNIDKETMPQQLVRRQDLAKYQSTDNPLGIYFSLEQTMWSDRKVGDDETAPHPSFINSTINGIFLFSNRLGILSGTSVSLTKTNDFFNFYPSTVTDVLDDEPIDLSVSDSNISNLLHALPNKDDLLLFSINGQFILNSGDEVLTAQTALITPILNYPASADIKPTVQGSVVYFLGKRGDYYVCREYFAQTNTQGLEAAISNSHCPNILKVNGSKGFIGGIPNENIIYIGGLDPAKLVIYKYEWNGNTKEQASWSYWEFYEPMVYACEFDSQLYCVMQSGRVLKMVFVRDDSLALDCLREFEAGENVTTLDNKDEIYNSATGQKVTGSRFDFKVSVGRPYKFIYEFSPIFLKLDNTPVGSIEVATPLRRVRFYLKGQCDFDLTLKNKTQGKDTMTYNYHTQANAISPYEKSFILRGDAKRTGVEVASTSVKPINLQSASFEILANLLVKPI